MRSVITRAVLVSVLLTPPSPWALGRDRVRNEAGPPGGLLRLVGKLYHARKPLVATAAGPMATAVEGLVGELARGRLDSLAFPGRSGRSRFVAEGADVVAGEAPRVTSASQSYIVWRDGRRFAALADADGRALCYAYSVPGRQLTAVLVMRDGAGATGRPFLIWSNQAGFQVLDLSKFARRRLSIKTGFISGPGVDVGTTIMAASWARQITQTSAGPLWAHAAPCFGVRFRPSTVARPGWRWVAAGADHSVPSGGSGYLLGFGGAINAGKASRVRRLYASHLLRLAPLDGGSHFPACSAVPGTMRGLRVKAVAAPLIPRTVDALLAISFAELISPDRREGAELSHFHRLDENPRAVAAFLKWVGGGAAAWYQHQGVRRLREICKAGAVLHGRGGQ